MPAVCVQSGSECTTGHSDVSVQQLLRPAVHVVGHHPAGHHCARQQPDDVCVGPQYLILYWPVHSRLRCADGCLQRWRSGAARTDRHCDSAAIAANSEYLASEPGRHSSLQQPFHAHCVRLVRLTVSDIREPQQRYERTAKRFCNRHRNQRLPAVTVSKHRAGRWRTGYKYAHMQPSTGST